MEISLSELFDQEFMDGEYNGRADFAFEEHETRRLCQRLQQEVNSALRDQAGRIVGPPKILYFDFIKSNRVNATSKAADGDVYLIGATQGMVSRTREAVLRLTADPEFYRLLRIDASPSDLTGQDGEQTVAQAFQDHVFELTFLFATNHELGHQVHGHTSLVGSNAGPETFAELERTQIRQAMEIEADGYAAFASLNTIFSPEWLARIEATVPSGQRVGIQQMWLKLFFLAAAAYLDASPGRELNWENLAATDYPPYFLRLEYFLAHIEGWCEIHQPHLVHVLGDPALIHCLLDLTSKAWERTDGDTRITLAKELTGADEDAYLKHIENLKRWRCIVRVVLAPHRWEIRGLTTNEGDGASEQDSAVGN
ncbi:MAG TPA: hypothetical protein VKX49_06615 [Bryobacteraceae bacterium]|nr:hypothetical protein [Bryobacteraceae bacterium]